MTLDGQTVQSKRTEFVCPSSTRPLTADSTCLDIASLLMHVFEVRNSEAAIGKANATPPTEGKDTEKTIEE